MDKSNKLSIIAFSGDLDKLLACFVLATGAAASGMEVTIFTTFWGSSVMRKNAASQGKKGFFEKVFGFLLPKGPKKLKLSKFQMAGMGSWAMARLMKKKGIANLEELMENAEALGVKINVCEMSMNLMGFSRDEMMDYEGLNFCGVATFLKESQNGMVLFI